MRIINTKFKGLFIVQQKNNSDKRRWTLLCCYNLAENNPFIDHHHPNYTPIKKLKDNQIKKAGLKFLNPNDAEAFLNRPNIINYYCREK